MPMRSYQRLCNSGLDGLTSTISRNPDVINGRILVRALADNSGQFVVIDGSRHVAALRQMAETGESHGAPLTADVTALFEHCPVTIVHPETDPAFVLALLGDATEPGADPWLLGQRDHLLRLLDRQGVHHSQPTLASAAAGNAQTVRRYHGYRALQQMMQDHDIAPPLAAALYPLFHAAVGRAAIRSWLDWDDNLCCFIDDSALDLFYRLLQPGTRVDGTARPACITTIGDVVQLCDVLAEPAARAVLMEPGATLGEAVEVINAGVFQQWTAQVGEVVETMKWDRRRFGPRS
ncbi:MAG TPA: hypothetical protein PK020_02765 [Ilumatobacteraceae bacterium]|nr:hypothetical protein [Ilumatobacteraceae bacterium]HRB02106.1 hypothetical protein [Ilumatobacteraceae bacterium]